MIEWFGLGMKMIISACDVQLASGYMSSTIEEDLKILDVKSETHLEDLDPNVHKPLAEMRYRVSENVAILSLELVGQAGDSVPNTTEEDHCSCA